jgi:hypothetical protein
MSKYEDPEDWEYEPEDPRSQRHTLIMENGAPGYFNTFAVRVEDFGGRVVARVEGFWTQQQADLIMRQLFNVTETRLLHG